MFSLTDAARRSDILLRVALAERSSASVQTEALVSPQSTILANENEVIELQVQLVFVTRLPLQLGCLV